MIVHIQSALGHADGANVAVLEVLVEVFSETARVVVMNRLRLVDHSLLHFLAAWRLWNRHYV